MINNLKNFFVDDRKNFWLLALLILIFVLIRIPGLDSPLHQDEYKWPIIVNPDSTSDIPIPHPPLSEFIYKTAGYFVGYDVDFRYVPLIFGAINLILLFYLTKFLFNKKTAIIATIVWIFTYYSVLASLMVDTDGQVMPFFFLLSLIGYYKLKYSKSESKFKWILLLAAGIIGGFLVKISFLLVPLAIFADYIWSKKHLVSKKDLIKYGAYLLSGLLFLAAILLLLRYVFDFFDLKVVLEYGERFFLSERGWFQTGIQVVKAFLYSSPLLVISLFFVPKKVYEKIRVFIFFLIAAFFFYIVLFDFSVGALDRYLQLMILPLAVFTAIAIGTLDRESIEQEKKYLLIGLLAALAVLVLQLIPHYVPPLHPKSDWIARFLSFKWNFVYPFSGGSGPLGFYVSFLVIAFSWIVSGIALVVYWLKPNIKKGILLFLIPVSLVYSLIFIEEYSFGNINGSAPELLDNAVKYIENNPDIEMVTVYNDNGGDEIMATGKYRKRLYTAPIFNIDVKVATLNKYKEHYYVLNIPRIDPDSPYRDYLESCIVIYNEVDRKISSTIYDCRDAPDLILKY